MGLALIASLTLAPPPTPAGLRSGIVAILTFHETYITAMNDHLDLDKSPEPG
jgi:hypothetical protein